MSSYFLGTPSKTHRVLHDRIHIRLYSLLLVQQRSNHKNRFLRSKSQTKKHKKFQIQFFFIFCNLCSFLRFVSRLQRDFFQHIWKPSNFSKTSAIASNGIILFSLQTWTYLGLSVAGKSKLSVLTCPKVTFFAKWNFRQFTLLNILKNPTKLLILV